MLIFFYQLQVFLNLSFISVKCATVYDTKFQPNNTITCKNWYTGKKSFKANIISLTKDIIVTSVTGADSRLTLVIIVGLNKPFAKMLI